MRSIGKKLMTLQGKHHKNVFLVGKHRMRSLKYCNLNYNSFNCCFVEKNVIPQESQNSVHKVACLSVNFKTLVTSWTGVLLNKTWVTCHSWTTCQQKLGHLLQFATLGFLAISQGQTVKLQHTCIIIKKRRINWSERKPWCDSHTIILICKVH